MSLVIVNKELYQDENSIWLNRYMSYNTFKEHFLDSDGINISLSRIDSFPDGLEGWNPKIENIQVAINFMAQFNNRVIEDGGEVVSNKCLLKDIIKGTSSSLFDEQLVEANINEREESLVSCWFASRNKDDENRVMWKLYGNRRGKLGVKIAIKWLDLKLVLENHKDLFNAGFVDYQGELDDNYMFKKEISYKHENEFRILKINENKEMRLQLHVSFNFLNNVHVCVDNSYKNKSILETLANFNFTQGVGKKSYSISKLIPEFKKNAKK